MLICSRPMLNCQVASALFGQVLEGFVVAEVDRQSADGPAL
jgi:hypothetical protein